MAQEHREAHKGKRDAPPTPANPLVLGLSPSEYVLRSLSNVRSADLEQALLLLPFNNALDLLGHLSFWLEKGIKVSALDLYAVEDS